MTKVKNAEGLEPLPHARIGPIMGLIKVIQVPLVKPTIGVVAL